MQTLIAAIVLIASAVGCYVHLTNTVASLAQKVDDIKETVTAMNSTLNQVVINRQAASVPKVW